MTPQTIGFATAAIAWSAAICVLVGALVERRRPAARWVLTAALGLLAVVSAAAYTSFGRLRGASGIVHAHEQFHFFLGSKYLEEVRYDGLYLATLAAAAESRGGRQPSGNVRDLATFVTLPAKEMAARSAPVKARFTSERWTEFVRDVGVLQRDLQAHLRAVLTDHGNTGSPSWAALASLFTATIPLGKGSATFFALLDPALLLLLIGTTWRAFGARTAFCVAILAFVPVRAWSYLGGSILRLDWLFAVGITACLMGMRRFKAAGLALAYAICSKPFTAVIAVVLGARFLIEAVRRRRPLPEHVAFALSVAVGLAFWVTLASIVFGGPEIWQDYFERILVTLQEGYYRGQYSMRDVYLQATAHRLTFLLDPAPRLVQASLAGVHITDHAAGFLLARMLLVAALCWVASRHDELFGFWIGVLAVFVMFVTNIYYWQMWLLLGLAAARAGAPRRHRLYLAAGLAIAGLDWIPEALRWPKPLHGFFGSFWLAWLVLLTLLLEVGLWLKARKEAPRESPPRLA